MVRQKRDTRTMKMLKQEGVRESKIFVVGILNLLILTALLVSQQAIGASTSTVAATVTVQNIAVSVAPGSIVYGTLASNTTADTNPTYTQTVTNDGNIAEDFFIKGQNTANWTLGATTASDQYIHKFCITTCATPPTNYTALTTSNTLLAGSVAASGTQTFDLEITTPNPSTVFVQQSVDVIITAAAP